MNPVLCIEEILKSGLDDWVDVAEIAFIVKSVGKAVTDIQIRNFSIEIIRNMIKEGLMEVGDVTTQGFHRWDLSADDALKRIEQEWVILGRLPRLGEICWLSNTEEGNKRVRNHRI